MISTDKNAPLVNSYLINVDLSRILFYCVSRIDLIVTRIESVVVVIFLFIAVCLRVE